MTTTTTTTTATATDTATATLADEQRKLYEAGEECCTRRANGEDVGADGELIFQRLGWTRDDITRHTHRIQNVRKWQLAAGSPAELDEAKQALERISIATSATVEQAQAEVAELQETIAVAERQQSAAQRIVTDKESAVDALRNLIPEHIKRQISAAMRAVRSSDDARDLRSLEDDIRTSEHILANLAVVNENSHEKIVAYCKTLQQDERQRLLVKVNHDRGYHFQVNEDAWQSYVETIRAELPTMEQRRDELQARYDSAIFSAEALRDFYWT